MKTYWVVGIAMAAGLSADAEECKVTVYVQAGIDYGVKLLGAEMQAATMFREIGVEVRWRLGVVPGRFVDGACDVPILVQLERSGNGTRVPENAFAYALPYAASGTAIHVLMDRVADRLNPNFEMARLAHVLVHEITHVLEQIDRHSDDGIMKAHWDSKDYARMRSHPLPFATIDVELIHEGIANRLRQAVGAK